MFLKSVSTKIWKAPKKYLSLLKKFYGVISPDFSVLRNMPLHKQKDAIFNGRLLAHWWHIAIGSLGCLKNLEERQFFVQGLEEGIKVLTPKNLIVHGALPKKFFGKCEHVTNILHFPC